MSVFIILLLPIPIVGWAIFLIADRSGNRTAYNILAAVVVALATVTSFGNEHGLLGFLLLETALLALFVLIGGVASMVVSAGSDRRWRNLLPTTTAVGLSLAITCIEIYRAMLQISAR